jgi:hypothetical protein
MNVPGISFSIQSNFCYDNHYRYRAVELTAIDEIIGLLAGWGGYSLQLACALVGIVLILGGKRAGPRGLWLGVVCQVTAGILVMGRVALDGILQCHSHAMAERLAPWFNYLGAVMLGAAIFVLPIILLSVALHHYLAKQFPMLERIHHWLASFVEGGILVLSLVLFGISPWAALLMCLLFLPPVVSVAAPNLSIGGRILRQLELVGHTLLVVVTLLLVTLI